MAFSSENGIRRIVIIRVMIVTVERIQKMKEFYELRRDSQNKVSIFQGLAERKRMHAVFELASV